MSRKGFGDIVAYVAFDAYQNVMIMEIPMTPLAKVAHLTCVST